MFARMIFGKSTCDNMGRLGTFHDRLETPKGLRELNIKSMK